jgi:hypothetical protein
MRTHPSVRLFCIIDTLTITSMLPGVDDSIADTPIAIVHGRANEAAFLTEARSGLRTLTTLGGKLKQRGISLTRLADFTDRLIVSRSLAKARLSLLL